MSKTTEKVYGGTGFITGETTARLFARTAASLALGAEAVHATLLQTMESKNTRTQVVQEIAGQTAVLHSAHNILITDMEREDAWPERLIIADAPKRLASKLRLALGGTGRQILHTAQGLVPLYPNRAAHFDVAADGYNELFRHPRGYFRLLDEIAEVDRYELTELALKAGVQVGFSTSAHDPIFPASRAESEDMISEFQAGYGDSQFYGYIHPGDHDFAIMDTPEFLMPFAVQFGTRK